MWGKNREKKGNRKSSWQKKPPQSPTAMPPLPPQPNGSERSNPAGCGDFPPWGPFPLVAAPSTAAGRVEMPGLPEAAAAHTAPGHRVEGRQAKSKWAATARVGKKSAAASGRSRGQGGHLGDFQNKATAPMK